MLRYPCRCRKCRSRKTLAKHPNEYIVRKYAMCQCGGDYRVDWYRRSKEHKFTKCQCSGLHYPHRKAGSVWCVNHPIGPSEADQQLRHRYL